LNTSIKQKEKHWEKFVEMCVNQWREAGNRYALTEEKEFTDLVCEAVASSGGHGEDWIAGNIIKYCGEIMNEKRLGNPVPEANFPKIAVWSFIWWLKHMGVYPFTKRDKGEEA